MSLAGLFGGRSDLPLKNDATSRFLPWLVAPMVFLSAVALTGAFILHDLVGQWNRDVSGTLTVEIPAAPGESGESADKTRAMEANALTLLRGTDGVISARALSQDELVGLLAPWLGKSDLLKELPMPALIDVSIRPDAPPDLPALSRSLAKIAPNSSVDDHRVWLARLINLSTNLEFLAEGVVILIGMVTSMTMVYATRSGMAVHRDVIEVLHLIGAPDDYIARQFAARAFILGLKGGVGGLLLTLPVLLGIGFWTDKIRGGFLADLSLPIVGWAVILALPLAAAMLATLTARLTVHRALAGMA